MKKKLFSTYLFSSMLLPIWLLVTMSPQSNDPAAQAIMEKVQARYEAYRNMKIQYVQSIQNAESDLDQQLGGTVYLMGDNFRIETAGQILMSDNQKLYVYFIEENELSIDFMEQDDVFKPSDIFQLYNKDFRYTLAGSSQINGKAHSIIQFTPIRKDAYDLHTIRLFINTADNSIARAELKDKSNNLITYDIKTITPNVNITNAFFVFNKNDHPGVIITDNTQ